MAIFPMKKEDFDKIYSLMEASFPKDEYKPYRAQKNLLEKPEYAWGARPLTIRALNSMLPSAIALPEERLEALDKELRQVIFSENGKKE